MCCRCSLLEEAELLPHDGALEAEEFPLPDIVAEEETEQEQGTPTITFVEERDTGDTEHHDTAPTLSRVTSAQISEIVEEECEDNLADGGQTLAKTYTVEEGFERPWDNLVSTDSVCGTEERGDEASDISDDDTIDNGSSSSSSSFPSESSGIFYKAEYTPPVATPPVTSHLSIENRDTYWRNFFSRSSAVSDKDTSHDGPRLQRTRSGCNHAVGDSAGAGLGKSKSDAKIGYSSSTVQHSTVQHSTVQYSSGHQVSDTGRQAEAAIQSDKCAVAEQHSSNEFITVKNTSSSADIGQLQQEAGSLNETSSPLREHGKKLEGQAEAEAGAGAGAARPRAARSPTREEVFSGPWTEVGGSSPQQQAGSAASLSTTISQEMQDLLASIQSLTGGEDRAAAAAKSSKQRPPQPQPPVQLPECRHREKNVDLESLMKEVESQIRFSVTAELLERMANCPSIENYFVSGVAQDSAPHPPPPKATPAPAKPPASPDGGQCAAAGGEHDTFLGSPPIPDLLQTTVKLPPTAAATDRLAQASFFSSAAAVSPDQARKRVTSLPRPSDMAGAGAKFPPTGRVPDMWSRVQQGREPGAEPRQGDTAQLSAVCADLVRVRGDLDTLCDMIQHQAGAGEEPGAGARRGSGDRVNLKLEQDLRDTQIVMKDIEHTVDSFRRHLSLPSGKVSRSHMLKVSLGNLSSV